jgi:ubiquinone/menaquinone biosynthesis C-methylase UbiE
MANGESSVPDKQMLVERFTNEYRLGRAGIMREIERRVCGCDYGGTSWTTRDEAQRLGELLGLEPGTRLIEVGAGSGWPGLYLAETTGCDAVLMDMPIEGLRIAAERAVADGLAETCRMTVADGSALPFADGCFDAILHSDVLCCLGPKLAVLKECRRVLQPGGVMVFTVIFIPQGLASADYARAVDCGPPVIETVLDYPEMLRQAGWEITLQDDLTVEYAASIRRQLNEEESHEGELREVYGDAVYLDKLTRRRQALAAIEQRFICREMFRAA